MVHLEWARVRGEITHVRELARFAGKDWRPEPRCLECGRELVARLGATVAWHFAHKARIVPCRAADVGGPATLRVHARYHLYRALIRGAGRVDRLMVERQCGRARHGLSLFDAASTCPAQDITTVARRWTHATTDHADAALPRIDLLVLRRDRPLFAWLVRNDRTLDPDEVAALDTWGVPWVESLATDDSVLDLAAWTPDRAIPYARLGAELRWRCAEHGPPQLGMF
ncbi:MAG: hypothetical protein ACI8PZ_005231 [Myxococcota bacterium]